MIDPILLAKLVCPVCRTAVAQAGEALVCQGCGRRYPIKDGLPFMRPEDGELPTAPPASDETGHLGA